MALAALYYGSVGGFDITVPQSVTVIDVLIVAGGGGGGGQFSIADNGCGGGGAGGLIFLQELNVTPGEVISCTIGSGGETKASRGYKGGNTVFGSYTAIGGAGGGGYIGTWEVPLDDGASGGGMVAGGGAMGSGGISIDPSQGNNGGGYYSAQSARPGAGGGGFSEAGQDAVNNIAGKGGDGFQLPTVHLAALETHLGYPHPTNGWFSGGGGGGRMGGDPGQGGLGGGGAGGFSSAPADAALPNTGGGGGGGAYRAAGGEGGDGVIIIFFEESVQPTITRRFAQFI